MVSFLLTLNRFHKFFWFSHSSFRYVNAGWERYESHIFTHMMRCTIWYHLYNLKNAKNTHGGVLILVTSRFQPATLRKLTLLHGCFSRFLNCTNGTKSRNASHIVTFSGSFWLVIYVKTGSYPISSQCSHFIPPETTRKFFCWCFQSL